MNQRLTDRNSASSVSETDLIHIVIPSDTTDGPDGSSYKVEIGRYKSILSIPDVFEDDVPVTLKNGDSLGRYHNGDLIPSKGKTFEWVINDIATDFIPPTFSLFTRTNFSPTILEVGETMVGGSQSFSWGVTTPNNINPSSLTLTQNISSTVIGYNLNYLGGTESYITTDNIVRNSPIENKVIYTISGVNNNGDGFNKILTASWRYRFYYGKNPSSDLLSSSVTSLSNSSLVVGVTNSYVTLAPSIGEYIYLIIPINVGQPSDFKDSVSGCFGNNIPFTNLGVVTVTNFGVTTTYNKYRSINTIDGSINVWMCV